MKYRALKEDGREAIYASARVGRTRDSSGKIKIEGIFSESGP